MSCRARQIQGRSRLEEGDRQEMSYPDLKLRASAVPIRRVGLRKLIRRGAAILSRLDDNHESAYTAESLAARQAERDIAEWLSVIKGALFSYYRNYQVASDYYSPIEADYLKGSPEEIRQRHRAAVKERLIFLGHLLGNRNYLAEVLPDEFGME